jgi:AcrR family transcriptional regulator
MRKDQPATQAANHKSAKRATRTKILKAARKVFAEHAYHAASIRMVGKAAGIDHPLVSYYFPAKAELFEAVLEDIVEENYEASKEWYEGLSTMRTEPSLALFLERLMTWNRSHPYAFRVLMLNMVQAQDAETIPGYQVIQKIADQSGRLFKNSVPLQASDREIGIFITSFNALVINYLGAKAYYAGILGIQAESRKYEKWVRDTLISIFSPRLKQLIKGGGSGKEI